jgi:TetR/AcrR family transcriptional repressor of nem operon
MMDIMDATYYDGDHTSLSTAAFRPTPRGDRVRYPAEETAARHERILDEAARLFREQGFGGVGVAEVMRAAGLTHGAFYAHFASKDALAAAGTERAVSGTLAHLEAALRAPDPEAAFVRGYLSAAHREHPGGGCAIAALGPEVARHRAARAPFTAQVRKVLDTIAGGFRVRRDRRARAHAIHLLSTLVGAMVLARAVDDPALSDEILAAARETLLSR